VGDFVSLIDGQRRIASCLHADTLEELTGILCSPPLRVTREALGRVGLILFMHVAPMPRGYRRRVASLWEADGQGGHRLVFRWEAHADRFVPTADLHEPGQLKRYEDFIQGLLNTGEAEMAVVRRRVTQFYEAAKDAVRDATAEKSFEGRE